MTSTSETRGSTRSTNVMCIQSLLNDQDVLEQQEQSMTTNERSYLDNDNNHLYQGPTSSYSQIQSTRSSHTTRNRRSRPKYSPEQEYYIWYHRIVLAKSWNEVLDGFRTRYNVDRPKSGLQCKFYRVLEDYKSRLAQEDVDNKN